MANSQTPLLDRVNEQPPILRGLTQAEFNLVALGSVVIAVLVGCLLFAMVWKWWFGLVIAPISSIALFFSISTYLAGIKLGKPPNYYPMVIRRRLEKLLGNDAMQHAGAWSILRRNRFEGDQ